MTILCRHGRKRDSESKGERLLQRFNYLGCEVKITFHKPSNSTEVRVMSVKLDHDHEVSADTFPFTELNEQEVEVIAHLHKANCKISEISRVVNHKFDKVVSNQKIRNLVRKISAAITPSFYLSFINTHTHTHKKVAKAVLMQLTEFIEK